MVKKSVFLFAVSAAPLLPAFSRLSYGIVFAIAFCVSFLALLGARKLISLSRLKGEWAPALELLCLVLCSCLYSSLARLVLPVELFAIDFFVYLVPVAYFLFDALSLKYNGGADSALVAALTAAAFPPALSLLRELLFFGTVTFPAIGEAHSVALIPSRALEFTRFFGSFPGSLILMGLAFWLWNALTAERPKAPLSKANDSSSS